MALRRADPVATATAEHGGIDEQVSRLANMAQPLGGPRFARRDYQRVIETHSRSWAHAAAIVDRILDRCTDLPSLAEVVEIAGGVPVPVEADTEPRPAGPCSCGGSGWLHVEREHPRYGRISGVDECVCRRRR